MRISKVHEKMRKTGTLPNGKYGRPNKGVRAIYRELKQLDATDRQRPVQQ